MLLAKIIAMLGAFILLSAIGFGPTVLLTSSRCKQRLLVSAALSPVVGFVLVALVLNSLFVLDITIRMSAAPITLLGLIVSTGCVYWDWQRRSEDYRAALNTITIARLKVALVLSTCVLIGGLLLLPARVGGEAFQYYQGSGHDSTNYILMARYAMDTPASYAGNEQHYQAIVNQNPALSVVMTGIARLRPSVTHILAWNSVLFNHSPYDLFYFHKLLHYLMAFCAALALGHAVGLTLIYTLALALVSGAGFWVMMVGDIDAFSQSSVISIGLLVVFALVQFELQGHVGLLSRARTLLALSLAGMMSFYPESFSLLLLGLALYYGLSGLLAPSWSKMLVILSHLATLIIALLLQNAGLVDTLSFWYIQSIGIIANSSSWNTWVDGVYRWLLRGREPFIYGVWGLTNFRTAVAQFTLLGILNASFILTLSVILAFIIGGGLYKSLLNLKAEVETRITACLTLVYWGGACLFYMMGLEGIAAKAFAMGAPFVIVAVFIFIRRYFAPNTISNRLIHVGLIIWVVLQTLIFPLRAMYAANIVSLPPDYIANINRTEFPQLVNPVVNTLAQQPPATIGTDFGGRRFPFYYLVLGMLADYHTVLHMENLNPAYDAPLLEGVYYWRINQEKIPASMLLAADRDYLSPLGIGTLIQKNDAAYYDAVTEHVVVYAVQPADFQTALYRADILNPDVPSALTTVSGMESVFLPKAGGSFARWMNSATSELRFISSDTQLLGLYLESTASYDGKLKITFNDEPLGQFQMENSTRTRRHSLCLTPNVGSNFLKFNHQTDYPGSAAPRRVLIQKLLFAPVDTLDAGAVSDARQIGAGWQAQENWGEETVRWAGRKAQVQLMTCPPVQASTLHFRAFVPPEVGEQSVSVRLNGVVVGSVSLQSGWVDYAVNLPGDALFASGLQTIELEHERAFTAANDTRLLAAAYDRFWFEAGA